MSNQESQGKKPAWTPIIDKETNLPVPGRWQDPNGYVVNKCMATGELSVFSPESDTPLHTSTDRNVILRCIEEHLAEEEDHEAIKHLSVPPGMKLDDFHPDTEEQAKITNYKGSNLVVVAFAGTGKTTTLIKYALKNPTLRILYVAYNRAIAEESTHKFPSNVVCMTAHSLAYHSLGKEYRHKLQNNLRLNDIIDLFEMDRNAEGVYDVASEILVGLNNFISSSDSKPDTWHLAEFGKKISYSPYWKEKAKHQLYLIEEVWRQMSDLDSDFPITHDGYLKLYQLSKPNLALRFGAILLDEAQDTTPAVASLVMMQDLASILVGDPHQQIYRFRGAEDSLSSDFTEGADRLYLTNSFRFGPNVAMVANALLANKGEMRKVIGRGGLDEVLFALPNEFEGQVSQLSRTVMGVIESAAEAASRQKKVYWVGGKSSYQVGDAMDVYYLSAGKRSKIQNKKLASEFRNFEEYKVAAENTRDPEMAKAARMVSTYGESLPALLRRLDQLTVERIEEADIVVCTAHRSKGLEFETVVLSEDFPYLFDKFYKDKPELFDDEINLLYVAVTRALKRLVINSIVETFIRARVMDQAAQKPM